MGIAQRWRHLLFEKVVFFARDDFIRLLFLMFFFHVYYMPDPLGSGESYCGGKSQMPSLYIPSGLLILKYNPALNSGFSSSELKTYQN